MGWRSSRFQPLARSSLLQLGTVHPAGAIREVGWASIRICPSPGSGRAEATFLRHERGLSKALLLKCSGLSPSTSLGGRVAPAGLSSSDLEP